MKRKLFSILYNTFKILLHRNKASESECRESLTLRVRVPQDVKSVGPMGAMNFLDGMEPLHLIV